MVDHSCQVDSCPELDLRAIHFHRSPTSVKNGPRVLSDATVKGLLDLTSRGI